jgi:hypothetical protein
VEVGSLAVTRQHYSVAALTFVVGIVVGFLSSLSGMVHLSIIISSLAIRYRRSLADPHSLSTASKKFHHTSRGS